MTIIGGGQVSLSEIERDRVRQRDAERGLTAEQVEHLVPELRQLLFSSDFWFGADQREALFFYSNTSVSRQSP